MNRGLKNDYKCYGKGKLSCQRFTPLKIALGEIFLPKTNWRGAEIKF